MHPRPLPRSGSSDPYCVVKVDNEVVARYGSGGHTHGDTVPPWGGDVQGDTGAVPQGGGQPPLPSPIGRPRCGRT